MKKLLFALLLLVSLPIVMQANPARKVTLAYDAQTRKLTATIFHPVKNVEKHYISAVTVMVGDKELEVKKLTKQATDEQEVVEFTLPDLPKGTEVTVKAKCNQFGSKSGKVILE